MLSPVAPKTFGPEDTVVVSLGTTVLSDLTCIECGKLIPYARAKRVTEKRNQVPKFDTNKCMHTNQVRNSRGAAKGRREAAA